MKSQHTKERQNAATSRRREQRQEYDEYKQEKRKQEGCDYCAAKEHDSDECGWKTMHRRQRQLGSHYTCGYCAAVGHGSYECDLRKKHMYERQCCETCGKINHKTVAWKKRRQYRVAASQSNRARRLHMQHPRNEVQQLRRHVAKRQEVVSRVERKWRRRSIATCKLSHS